MKPSTLVIVLAALRGDETVPKADVDKVSAILEGRAIEPEKPLLVSANEAARLLGRGRTWFWEKRKADLKRADKDKLFPPVGDQPREHSYRREDLIAYANNTTTSAPTSRRKPKNKKI